MCMHVCISGHILSSSDWQCPFKWHLSSCRYSISCHTRKLGAWFPVKRLASQPCTECSCLRYHYRAIADIRRLKTHQIFFFLQYLPCCVRNVTGNKHETPRPTRSCDRRAAQKLTRSTLMGSIQKLRESSRQMPPRQYRRSEQLAAMLGWLLVLFF